MAKAAEAAITAVAAIGNATVTFSDADVSLIAEAPKVGPHRDAMRQNLADFLGISIDRCSVKATTNEKIGFIGRREGIAAIATATVRLPLNDGPEPGRSGDVAPRGKGPKP